MKVFFLTIFVLFFVLGNMYSDMPEINIEEYTGKEVFVFLGDLNGNFNRPDRFSFLDDPPGKLKGGMFYFEDYIIAIYISTYNYINSFDIDRNWQFDDFLKEEISYILVRRLQLKSVK
jgi:hypothetical protein